MRRAIIATAGTIAGLVALLSYKSSGSLVQSSHVAVAQPPTTQAPSTSTAQPPTTQAPSTSTPQVPTAASFTGADVQYAYGDIQLRVAMSGTRIDSITVPQESAPDPRSQFINSQAVPILTREALAAQGVRIDVVSGATFTSDAFAQALQSALGMAGG